MRNHEIFSKFKPWSGELSNEYEVNFLGAKINKKYICVMDSDGTLNRKQTVDAVKVQMTRTDYPKPSEEYFEFISILESVIQAKDKFVMIELGAGVGPNLSNAAAAIKSFHGESFPYKLIGVEGEPTCFEWMKDNFRLNNIKPENTQFIQAVVCRKDGEVVFEVGFPGGYGSSIVSPAGKLIGLLKNVYRFLKRTAKRLRGSPLTQADYWTGSKGFGIKTSRIKAVSLNTILKGLGKADLIHFDIKGEEFDVVESARELLNSSVKKIHIGTHNETVEQKLRKLLPEMGWVCMYDFAGRGTRSTEFGDVAFDDGIQVWLNKRFTVKAS